MTTKFERAIQGMEAETPKGAPEVVVPRGFKIVREPKNVNTALAMRRSSYEIIKEMAAAQGVSRNELINQIVEEYIANNYKE